MGVHANATRSTLRRRWAWVVAALISLALGSGTVCVVTVQGIVEHTRGMTRQVQVELTAANAARAALDVEIAEARHLVQARPGAARRFAEADAAATRLMTGPHTIYDSRLERALLDKVLQASDAAFGPLRPLAGGVPSASDVATVLGDQASALDALDRRVGPVLAAMTELQGATAAHLDVQFQTADSAEKRLFAILALAMLALVAGVVLCGIGLRRNILQPLLDLREAAGRLGDGRLDHRLQIARDDEFGALARSFNAMADSLDAQHRRLAAESRRSGSVVDSAPAAFVSLDATGSITEWNGQAEALFGVSRADALGADLADLVLARHARPVLWELIARTRGAGPGGDTTFTVDAVRPGERPFCAEFLLWALDEDGLSFHAFVTDVSERDRLNGLQSRLAAIVESSDEAILSVGVDGVIASWNPGAARLFGYDAAEAVGRPLRLLAPSGKTTTLKTTVEQTVRERCRTALETDVRTKDAGQIRVAAAFAPMLMPDGELLGLKCVAHDITQQHVAEEELARSREMLRAIVDNAPAVITVRDTEGRYTLVNRYFAELVGREAAELIGLTPMDVFPPDIARSLMDQDRAMLGGGVVAEREERVPLPGGTRTFWAMRFPIFAAQGEGRGAGLVSIDVTDRARLETELRHSQKLESVGLLASGIAHEINTPIQYIGDNLRFLGDSFGDLLAALRPDADQDPDVAFLAEEIPLAIGQTLQGVDRVVTIVRAMKAFGHPSGEAMETADLNDAVRNTLIVAASQVKYVADSFLDLADIPPVRCYPGDVNQVLLNLVVNGAQAIAERVPAGGGRGRITVRTRREADDVVIEVEDTGGGIPAAIAERVFEPFFTTKDVGVGTGQGLALAYSLVTERHGGSIRFASAEGVGTIFTVRLPITGSPEAPPDVALPVQRAAPVVAS